MIFKYTGAEKELDETELTKLKSYVHDNKTRIEEELERSDKSMVLVPLKVILREHLRLIKFESVVFTKESEEKINIEFLNEIND